MRDGAAVGAAISASASASAAASATAASKFRHVEIHLIYKVVM